MTMHSHGAGGESAEQRSAPWLVGIVVGLGAITSIMVVVLWPGEQPTFDRSELGLADAAVVARVVDVSDGPCGFATNLECRRAEFVVVGGPDEGLRTWQEFEISAFTPEFEIGEGVVLRIIQNEELGIVFEYSDRDRRGVLVSLLLLFTVAVVALGRLRGLAAIAGLAVSVAILVGFISPSIISGNDPVLVATVGGAAIALIALYLTHGWRNLTHVAVVGTFSALALTLGLSWVVAEAARFSGFATEEAVFVSLVGTVDVSGLLLAGAVLGAIGALDDITVTQASTVLELRQAGEEDAQGLYRRGIRVGRDHIASTVNTLFLAYAGASLPLILLSTLSGVGFGLVANSEMVAVEVVRTLVGSVGLVAAVPLTTGLAAWLLTRDRAAEAQSSR